jgi:hypothetical protein
VGGSFKGENMIKLILLTMLWSALLSFMPGWMALAILMAGLTSILLVALKIKKALMSQGQGNFGRVATAEVISIR